MSDFDKTVLEMRRRPGFNSRRMADGGRGSSPHRGWALLAYLRSRFDQEDAQLAFEGAERVKGTDIITYTGPNAMETVDLEYVMDCFRGGIECCSPSLFATGGTLFYNMGSQKGGVNGIYLRTTRQGGRVRGIGSQPPQWLCSRMPVLLRSWNHAQDARGDGDSETAEN